MSYIGQRPVVGRYIKLDQISSGFNGSNTGFSMTAGSQAVFPGTARNLLLSLGGVIQEPDTDFTISGSTLTFTTPPVANTTFFGVIYGDMQATGTPSDGTVLPASIASSGNFSFPEVTVTGDVNIADSIIHSGDTDTKIRFGAANEFSVETGGVERLELTGTETVFNDTGVDTDFRIEGDTNANLFKVDAGNDRVGIGTSSPQQVFHVYHAADNGLARFESGDANCRIDLVDNSGQSSIEAIGNQLRFGTSSSNTERMRISSTGNVGIGTTSPNAKFVISDSSTFTAYGGSVPSIGDCMQSLSNVPASEAINNHATFQFGVNGGSHNRVNSISAVAESASNRKLAFAFCTDSGSNRNERMRISADGNVGIGTASPVKALHNALDTTLITGTAPQIRLNGNANDGSDNDRAIFGLATSNSHFFSSSSAGDAILRTTATGKLLFGTGTAEHMRLDSAGRLLIGTTTEGHPAADEFTIANTASGADMGITLRSATNGQGAIYFSDGTSGDDEYRGIINYNHSSNFFSFFTNATERMRIDSSGRVIIGTTSHIGGAQFVLMGGNINTYGVMAIGNKVANPSSGTFASFRFNSGASGTRRGAELNVLADGAWTDGSSHPSRMAFHTTTTNSAGADERLRITHEGDIVYNNFGTLFGNAGMRIYNTLSGGPQVAISRASGNPLLLNRNTSDGEIVDLRRGWSAGGSIHVGVNSATYNTSSDYRLKENIVAISDGITRLKTLKPSRFNWIGDTSSTRDGFIAHEVTAVPEAITGTKDEVYTEDQPDRNIKAGDPKYQGIDQSKLVPLLTAALQEAISKIETLETKVAALEAA